MQEKQGNTIPVIVPSNFAIRQEYIRQNLANPLRKIGSTDFYPVGIDIGYSSSKGYGASARFAFPTFAKQLTGALMAEDDGDILIRDLDAGETWMVGKNVLTGLSSDDTNIAGEEWYGRKRYNTRAYRVIIMAALGMAAQDSGGAPLKVETGLPPAFRSEDTRLLKAAFSGIMNFTMKAGKRPAQTFHLDLKEDDIDIIDQPMGTLYSVITEKNGSRKQGWQGYFKENTIILDGGFVTLDIVSILGRQISNSKSYREYGMHEVLARTAKEIYSDYGRDILVSHLLPNLNSGEIIVVDETTLSDQVIQIMPYLSKASSAVCSDALNKLISVAQPIKDYHHLIASGGTGAAWYPQIQERFKNLHTLNVEAGDPPDGSGWIYANPRGYYYYLIDMIRELRRGR